MHFSDILEESHQKCLRPFSLDGLQEVLSDQEIDTVCSQLGHRWRNRRLPPVTMVRSMVYRSLNPDKSIKAILASMAAADDSPSFAPSDAAWCRARSRLPEGLCSDLARLRGQTLVDQVGDLYLYQGRPLYIADGTTLSMPDTPELVEAFGYADTKHGPSRFPVGRATFLVRAGVEAVTDYRFGPYTESEEAQLHRMWDQLPSRAIYLWDRKFSSFLIFTKCRQRGLDVITRLHQRRDPRKLVARGKRLGPGEWIVPLYLAPALRKHYNDPSLPDVLHLRLIRHRFYDKGQRQEQWLITTLLNPIRYSRSSIINLYPRRWGIETRIGSLKTTLQMNVLRSKTAPGARSEVAATILAYNLVWTVIHQAAQQKGTSADRISFSGAVKFIVAFSAVLQQASSLRRHQVYGKMLNHIAQDTNQYRPGRSEPRCLKRDPVRYPFLRVSRREARQLCLC